MNISYQKLIKIDNSDWGIKLIIRLVNLFINKNKIGNTRKTFINSGKKNWQVFLPLLKPNSMFFCMLLYQTSSVFS